MSAKNEGRYRSAFRLALWASILFLAHAVTAAVAALLNAYQLALLSVFRFGGTIPHALAEAQDVRQRVVAGFEFGIELAALILLLTWLYRISQNTWFLGAEGMQYTPGWSVGWFFVPVAGLVMPYNVFNELWRANSPSATGQWRQAAVSPILGVWWAACVASAVIHYSPLQVVLGQRENDVHARECWLDQSSLGFLLGSFTRRRCRNCRERADRRCDCPPHRLAEASTCCGWRGKIPEPRLSDRRTVSSLASAC